MRAASTVVLNARDLVVQRGSGRDAFRLTAGALSLRAGQTTALIGPNGAGKSTLLLALAGLVPRTSGSVEHAGPAPVAMVFQRPLALAGSVLHNVTSALHGLGLGRPERRRRALESLVRFGIPALESREASTLSGGELRRLALARAFARRPAVLLLDEPFDDLDSAGQESLGLDLRSACEDTGVALAVVTHDLRHALLLADRIAVLIEGQLVQEAPRDRVLDAPASPAIARLVGMTNLVAGVTRSRPGDAAGRVVVDPEHWLPAPRRVGDGETVWAGIRPEALKVDVGRGEGEPIGKARVRHVLGDGALVTLVVDWAGRTLRAHLLAGRGLARTLAPGDSVSLSLRAQDVHLLPRSDPSRPAGEPGSPSRSG